MKFCRSSPPWLGAGGLTLVPLSPCRPPPHPPPPPCPPRTLGAGRSHGQVHGEHVRPSQRAVGGAVPAAGARTPLAARAGAAQGRHAAVGGAEPGSHLHRGVRLQRREEPGGQQRVLPQRGGAAQAGHQHPRPHERQRPGPQVALPRRHWPLPLVLCV